jgi:hypothetical protein
MLALERGEVLLNGARSVESKACFRLPAKDVTDIDV